MNWENVEEAARLCAGNWREFDSFVWHDEPDDGEDWFIVNTHGRDSGLLARSNAEAIGESLKDFPRDVIPMHSRHWAFGWVDGFAVRVYRRPGPVVTDAFRRWCELSSSLADYPVLDEEDFCRREHEATLENIGQVGKPLVIDTERDWPREVFDYFWDHDQDEVQPVDGGGGWPSEKGMKQALFFLGLLGDEHVFVVERNGETLLRTPDEDEAYRLAEDLSWKATIKVSEEVVHEGER